MERLTFESDGYFAVSADNCYEDQNENYCGPAIERLAVYEGTGLAPADVVDLMGNHGMALMELSMVPKWISVTERLPEDDASVLVAAHNGKVVLGSLYRNPFSSTGYAVSNGQAAYSNASHWMLLPEPPKEVKYAEM